MFVHVRVRMCARVCLCVCWDEQMFVRDLTDGYFPWELKDRYPEGVPLAAEDHR